MASLSPMQKEGISAKIHRERRVCAAELFINLYYEIFT